VLKQWKNSVKMTTSKQQLKNPQIFLNKFQSKSPGFSPNHLFLKIVTNSLTQQQQ